MPKLRRIDVVDRGERASWVALLDLSSGRSSGGRAAAGGQNMTAPFRLSSPVPIEADIQALGGGHVVWTSAPTAGTD